VFNPAVLDGSDWTQGFPEMMAEEHSGSLGHYLSTLALSPGNHSMQ
jgi:hypothetical protein